ncbi:MAG: hypothetical protein QM759_04895 [Terricaulis sp.]
MIGPPTQPTQPPPPAPVAPARAQGAPRDGARFAALLQSGAAADDPTSHAATAAARQDASFAETSVFGLGGPISFGDDAPHQHVTPTLLSALGPSDSLQVTTALSTSMSVAEASEVQTQAKAQALTKAASNHALPRAHASADDGPGAPGQALAEFGDITLHEDVHLTAAPRRARFWSAALSTNVIRVALLAADHGLSVIARVGRMSRTELQRLRQGMRAILQEHGVGEADIKIATPIAEDDCHG